MKIEEIKNKVINGYEITKEEAMQLINMPSDELFMAADEIRKHFCGNRFDACTIINIKSGKCSEDCKFCAQSMYYDTNIEEYLLLNPEELLNQTLQVYNLNFKRISYVSSGRKISKSELDIITELINNFKKQHDDVNFCVSLGLLSDRDIDELKKVGIDRIHNNLETSQDMFANICTTHTYQEKLETLQEIKKSDVLLCCGGIFGLGETFKNRIDLAFTLRNLNIKSIPINVLNPIENTPLEKNEVLSNEEVCKIVALFRFINPDAYIRMAGGRLLLEDYGKQAFKSGSNAAILGNMLTTMGVSYEKDLQMIKELGYNITYDI